jgi:hypothetical protein
LKLRKVKTGGKMKTTMITFLRIFVGLGFILSLIGGSNSSVKAAPALDLFFSEYIEGSSNNKALEIYNPTAGAIDLSADNYNIQMFFNGNASAGLTISLTGSVAAGDVFVIAHSSANATILAQADQTNGSGWYNGDDAIVLRKGTTVLDVIGKIGTDPGSEWGTGFTSTGDNTLRRKCNVLYGDTIGSDDFDPALEWDGYATDTFSGLGTHIITCIPKLNEFSASTTGTDVEYVEIFGASSYDFSAYSVLEIEGDFATTARGVVDEVIALGTTDADGLYLASLAANALENGTLTLLLVRNFSGALNDDLDTNDDGVFDVTPWDAIVDAVAVNDGGAGDLTYGTPTLGVGYDGLSFAPGGASRIPDGFDTDAATDWVRNDFDLAGIPGYSGTIVLGEAYNTPGALNVAYTPPPEACGDPYTLISAVQGNGLASPLVGTEVAVEGVVVGDFQNNAMTDNGNLNGFFLQSYNSDVDADPLTSEGIFIYYPSGSTDVRTSDIVRVRGNVSEYNGVTEITVAQIWVCSIDNINLAPTEIALPVSDVNDFEAFEGMLVTFPQDLVISEYFNYDRYGEIVLTSERHLTPTALYEPGSPEYYDAVEAFTRDKITLDDGRTSQNPNPAIHPNGLEFTMENLFRGGDLVTNVTGVMDYSFGLYRIHPTKGADYTSANPRPETPASVGGNIKVVSMNVLNYFSTIDTGAWICGPSGDMECRGADTAEEFTRQHDKIMAAITAMQPDVAGLIEIENHATDAAVQTLVNGLNAILGAGTYDYIPTGPIGSDAIKVAIIYNTATVAPVGDFAVLDSSVDSRFLDTKNRPVLAQTFVDKYNGMFTVVVNHLKSKGSDCDDVGDPDLGDGAGNCNLTRVAAAQAEMDWLASDPTGSGDPDFLIIGDLNSYDKEDPIDAFRAGADDIVGTADDFVDMTFEFQGEAAYSYVFDGMIGYLDYAVSGAMMSQVTGTTVWHVNADEPDLIDYDMSFKASAQDALYAPDEYRYSDHDPVIIGLDLLYTNAGGPYTVVEGNKIMLSIPPQPIYPAEGPLTYSWDLDNDGIFETPGIQALFDATALAAPATYKVNFKVTNSIGLYTIDSTTVVVIYNFNGFLSPLKNPDVLNVATAGLVLPVKFRIGGDRGLDILAARSPSVTEIDCPVGATKNQIIKYTSLSDPVLKYKANKLLYKFTWQTDPAWAGTCQLFTLELNDGTTHSAIFKFK